MRPAGRKGRPAVTDRLVTAKQMARLMEVNPCTVLYLARAGRIPSIRLTPRLIRFDPAAVMTAVRMGAAVPGRPASVGGAA